MSRTGSSLVIHWLRLSTFTAEGLGFKPTFGEANNLQAVWCSQKIHLKKKKKWAGANAMLMEPCEGLGHVF